MALMSAAEYAAMESSKKAEKAGLANQAAQKAASSSVPSSNSYASSLMNARNNTSMSQPGASSSNAKSKVSYSAPSLGSLYKNVAGTDWQSTNPDNPNASKYYADGSPVPTIGFDYSQTGGPKFDGYGNPEQFKNIMNMAQGNDQVGISNYLQSLLAKGELTPNDSIYKNGLSSDPRQISLSGVYSGGSGSGGVGQGTFETLPGKPGDRNTGATQLPGRPGDRNNGATQYSLLSSETASPTVKTATMTPTSGYVKNPTVDAMPIQQQLDYYKQHPEEAKQEVARAEGIGGAGAMNWANQLKSSLSAPSSQQSAQSWINDPRSNQGGLDNYVNTQKQRYQDALASGDTDLISRLQTDAQRVGYSLDSNKGVGTPTGTGNDKGTGTGQAQSATDLIRSIYDSNYSSQSQKLKSARDLQLAGLAGQEGIINQNTTNNLNSNDVMANQRMQALKEAMANAGLSASGDNISAQVGLGNSQQQSATDINNNKTNQLANLLAQRNAINNNASADDLALLQQLQAQRDGLLLNQSNADRTFNYNAGRDAVGDSQWSKSFGLQEGQLTGNYDPNASVKQQMAANSAAWFNASPSEKLRLAAENQKLGASIGAKQDANGDWVTPQSGRTLAGQQMDAAEAQRQWDNAFKGKQFDQQVASELWDRTFKEKTFDQSVKQFAANLGQDYAKMSQSAQQFAAEMAFKNKAQQLDQEKFDFSKSQAGNKQDQLDSKSFATERDGMISAIRANKVNVNDAMTQINQDEQMGVYTPDLAEKLRTALRVLSGTTSIPNDPKNNIQIDLSGYGNGGSQSVSQNVFGG